ncbi:MAG: peptidoglycan-binding domain-containing protein [Mesorhizobium sp.]
MARSESRLDEDSPVQAFLRAGLFAAGQAIIRNPVTVAGATAFIVTLSYVSGNALWNQAQPHESAFFITREMTHFAAPGPVDAAVEQADDEADVRQIAILPRPTPDAVVKQVQGMLAGLSLYTGAVDGLTGPQTRKAIEDYQRLNGMSVTGDIDDELLDELRAQSAADPTPAPRRNPAAMVASAEPVPAPRQFASAEVEKVQAGLRAFGRGDIEIDGVIGSRTRTAISEFQTLFGLPVTGEPDAPLVAKMREIGLTN